jgi:hypothetical protein
MSFMQAHIRFFLPANIGQGPKLGELFWKQGSIKCSLDKGKDECNEVNND